MYIIRGLLALGLFFITLEALAISKPKPSVDLTGGQAKARCVHINTTPAADLAQHLLGIGSKKAEAIVVYRKIHGKFYSIEDLRHVKGISKRLIERNKNRVCLD